MFTVASQSTHINLSKHMQILTLMMILVTYVARLQIPKSNLGKKTVESCWNI
jgi:hypothetical protein